MREAIWVWVLRGRQEGTLLPWWAMFLRVVLFPLETLYWALSKRRN